MSKVYKLDIGLCVELLMGIPKGCALLGQIGLASRRLAVGFLVGFLYIYT